ncbi:AmpG family muropeptide MFS transporter [Aliikangiella coralliicola]|uniref:AmpG family muropeptide MFS transporter n=2 Tax=Aliikangiella coralliicola TaxID=2592383 RepID=A0A545TWM8_9GAMM|nr:AmpG family muropeptide MFS transporter [Aliikangiella coralliicola]
MVVCLFTGFASGLPLYLLIQLVPGWLRNNGVDLSTIGLFGIILFSYNWKFVWSPLMERYTPPFLGKRKGWMILTQVPLIALTSLLIVLQPSSQIGLIAMVVGAIGFFSASQDIVLDAYRRELLTDDEMGMGTSIFVNAYKFSSLIPGGLSLIIADWFSWEWAIGTAVIFLFVGLITTLIINELPKSGYQPVTIQEAVIDPFKEFFNRNGWREAALVLLFLVLYKLGDNMAVALETPFFFDMGFNGTEIGTVAKLSKLWASIIGTAIGGIIMIRLGINKALWIFGFFQIGTILGYAVLAQVGNNIWVLFAAVSMEYLGVGLGTVGVLSYMSKLTSRKFTATQFALLSSIATIPRTFAGATTGFIIEAVGYFSFFVICFCCAIPGMLLLLKVAPWNGKRDDE